MKERTALSKQLYQIMLNRGYPENLCDLVTKNLNTDFTASRMIGYLSHYSHLPDVEVVDEMLAICSEIDAWRDKKVSEEANAKYNEMLYYGLGTEEEASDNSGGEKAKLSFESFDGGGPDFNVLIADEGIVSYETEVKYHSSDHGEMTGSGFDKIITFTGIKPGETTVIVEERSPIADNLDHKCRVTVDDELNVKIELLTVKDIN